MQVRRVEVAFQVLGIRHGVSLEGRCKRVE
jgi:hypothetical protein